MDHRRERLRPRTVPSLGSEHPVPVVGHGRLAARARGARRAPRCTRRGHDLVRGVHPTSRWAEPSPGSSDTCVHISTPTGGVSLTNDPADPGRFERWHLYHPVEPPITVEPGDEVDQSRFTINQRGELSNWQRRGERRDTLGVAVPGELPRPAGDVRSARRPRPATEPGRGMPTGRLRCDHPGPAVLGAGDDARARSRRSVRDARRGPPLRTATWWLRTASLS